MRTSPIIDRIYRETVLRKENGLYRQIHIREPDATMLDCSTNSYLGLHTCKEITDAAQLLAGEHTGGNLASRLVAESSPLYRILEQEIAEWEGTDDALVFTSGYTANIGILQALCTRATEVFTDRLNHASIYDGIRLAGCKMNRYAHTDMHDLERRLKASSSTEKIIITDTVFSMDGDTAPLADIAGLAVDYNALVIVDEAHATGLFGSKGSGLVEATGTAGEVAIRMGTLSKAVAGLGGYVAVSSLLRDYFVNFSRSVIYSTGLPGSVLAYDLAAVRYLRAHPQRAENLQRSAAHFRSLLEAAGFTTAPSTTQIVPCYTASPAEAIALKRYLHERGIIVAAIRPPTVPEGTSRLRFSWSSLCSDSDAERIVAYLVDWRKLHG